MRQIRRLFQPITNNNQLRIITRAYRANRKNPTWIYLTFNLQCHHPYHQVPTLHLVHPNNNNNSSINQWIKTSLNLSSPSNNNNNHSQVRQCSIHQQRPCSFYHHHHRPTRALHQARRPLPTQPTACPAVSMTRTHRNPSPVISTTLRSDNPSSDLKTNLSNSEILSKSSAMNGLKISTKKPKRLGLFEYLNISLFTQTYELSNWFQLFKGNYHASPSFNH